MPGGISGRFRNTYGAREFRRQQRFKSLNLSDKTFSQIWDDGYRMGYKDGQSDLKEEVNDDKKA